MTTQHEIRKVCDVSARLVTLTAAETLTQHVHEGRILLMDNAAAVTYTLPQATGSGAVYKFVIKTVDVAAGAYVIEAGASVYVGTIVTLGDDSTNNAEAFVVTVADAFGTCTFNGTTTGGVAAGDWIEFTDYAAGQWFVRGVTNSSGTEATPFT